MIIYLQSGMSDMKQVKLCLLENNGVYSLFLSKNLFFVCLWFQKESFLQIYVKLIKIN